MAVAQAVVVESRVVPGVVASQAVAKAVIKARATQQVAEVVQIVLWAQGHRVQQVEMVIMTIIV